MSLEKLSSCKEFNKCPALHSFRALCAAYIRFVEASGLLSHLKKATFCVCLVVFYHVFSMIHVAHKALQKKDSTLSQASSVMESTIKGLESMRTTESGKNYGSKLKHSVIHLTFQSVKMNVITHVSDQWKELLCWIPVLSQVPLDKENTKQISHKACKRNGPKSCTFLFWILFWVSVSPGFPPRPWK